jgi:hypothetical protein
METFNGSRRSHHLSHPPVAAAPASAANRLGCAGGSQSLDDLGLRTRRRRHSHLPALSPRASPAGHVERSRHVDRCPHATRRQAVRLNRWPPRPQQSWPAMPLPRPPWPGRVWVWLGLLVGTLVLAWPGVSAAWPAVDRPRTSMPEAVSPLLALPLSDEAPIAHPPLTSPLGEGPLDLHPTRGDRTARCGASPPHGGATSVPVHASGEPASCVRPRRQADVWSPAVCASLCLRGGGMTIMPTHRCCRYRSITRTPPGLPSTRFDTVSCDPRLGSPDLRDRPGGRVEVHAERRSHWAINASSESVTRDPMVIRTM